MNVLSRVLKYQDGATILRPEPPQWMGPPMPQRHRLRVADDEGAQQMRWIGVALCLVSAAITVASATFIVVRF